MYYFEWICRDNLSEFDNILQKEAWGNGLVQNAIVINNTEWNFSHNFVHLMNNFGFNFVTDYELLF